ncbi:RIP metalloprotease RseP [Neogemmobacter tilapiae]|uniref:Zinc metalloprotease n=1 Tax=Neogemmobacter tilapiae TaxID=875041 RepID=A0A918TSS8_9RHOB|nr:RIP metalloprotease RseP [Gemmobacter tilapiae]GHC58448.1 zinc metalloprotease [Gemmobacter tilapiae]
MNLFESLPDFGGGIPFTVVAFVIALSIIVFVHEYGHYIIGRWSGIHAETFSIGFGPVLFSRVDKRGTKWQVAAIPLGGYVKFLGDANAASLKDGEAMEGLSQVERRHTMHGAPLWARAATVAAGPGFNFIFALLVFAGMSLWFGVATERAVVGELKPIPGVDLVLKPGDVILSINGQPTPDLEALAKVQEGLRQEPSLSLEIERTGQKQVVETPNLTLPYVEFVNPQSAASEAGIESGDRVIAIDGKPIFAFADIRANVDASGGKPLELTILRSDQRLNLIMSPKWTDTQGEDGNFERRLLLGLSGGLFFTPELRSAGPIEAITLGGQQVWTTLTGSLSGLWHIVTGSIGTCSMKGMLGIAQTSGAAASHGLDTFINFLALLSTAVGLLNLMPLRILDGGHLAAFAYEAVARRPHPQVVENVLIYVSLCLILTLFLVANFNDLRAMSWVANGLQALGVPVQQC